MEIVFALILAYAGPVNADQDMWVDGIAPVMEMTVNECLNKAREFNWSEENSGYRMVCVPKQEPPVES